MSRIDSILAFLDRWTRSKYVEALIGLIWDCVVILLLLVIGGIVRVFRAIPEVIKGIAWFLIAILNTKTVAVVAAIIVGIPTLISCGLLAWHIAAPFTKQLAADLSLNAERIQHVPLRREVAQQPQKQPEQAALPERLRKDKRMLECAALTATDDMVGTNSRLYAAITNFNIAAERATRIDREDGGQKYVELVVDTCPTGRNYEALLAPGDGPFTWPRLEAWQQAFETSSDEVQRTMDALSRYLDNPDSVLREQPWLLESRRYVREKKSWLIPANEAGMQKSMCLLWGDPKKGAAFYGSKKPDGTC